MAQLTPLKAYIAACADHTEAQMIAEGHTDPILYERAFRNTLIQLWQGRVERGELPPFTRPIHLALHERSA